MKSNTKQKLSKIAHAYPLIKINRSILGVKRFAGNTIQHEFDLNYVKKHADMMRVPNKLTTFVRVFFIVLD